MLNIHLPTDRRHRWDGRRQRQGPDTMAHPEDFRIDSIARRRPFLPGTSRSVSGAVPTARIFRPARSVMSSGQRRKPVWVLEFEPTAPLIPEALPQTRCNESAEQTNLPAPASCCLKNTMTQQVESGTPAHGALDGLQVADLPFHRSGTPGQ